MKHIFVLGGVTSSLGKGILSASIGKALQANGYSVAIQKFDPYINVDPGTLNPYEHGECFVTDDGAETDLDLGHYERFLNINTSKHSNVTAGRIYLDVITKERRGDFLGKTVQVIPHITDEIKKHIINKRNQDVDILITEIGGTVGDIESLPFVESIRQARLVLPKQDSLVILLTLVPYLKAAQELKSKPTQNSVRDLREAGVQADILVCRVDDKNSLDETIRKKIALFCNLHKDDVIEAYNANSIYEVPDNIIQEKLDRIILDKLGLKKRKLNLTKWQAFLKNLNHPKQTVHIALVGKYIELQDAYKSIYEAFTHAGAFVQTEVKIKQIHSETINAQNYKKLFKGIQGILIAPGFGKRGTEGKIFAAQFGREHNVPLLGICLGLQICCIEFARNVLQLKNANSTEFEEHTPHPVIHIMHEQKKVVNMGASMRLGAYPCHIQKDTETFKAYKKINISERHRHRFEVNNHYRTLFEQHGFMASGVSPDNKLVEIMELKNHPFFIGVQFHPEYKSTPENPHPLFIQLIKASSQQSIA